MCVIQVGAEDLENILASRGPDIAGEEAAACGVQVGTPELSRILANRKAAPLAAEAACGIQVGAPENVALPRDADPAA
ncbi:hypothetical protein O7602_10500 [Micromonospora sp. WMMD1128]|uniref:hypothetical protein n=1 Tax=Micromonospora sp. WMMD1128 TaxID=3015150 RepID=UPI00248D24A5|nr:hypothetical protein [Micromonospora sp. WMMD1128]WBB75907.1 hypothetical protein O7602_10500 [Micromonospora sp. WMMD1128]